MENLSVMSDWAFNNFALQVLIVFLGFSIALIGQSMYDLIKRLTEKHDTTYLVFVSIVIVGSLIVMVNSLLAIVKNLNEQDKDQKEIESNKVMILNGDLETSLSISGITYPVIGKFSGTGKFIEVKKDK